jgi:hypothetical protein
MAPVLVVEETGVPGENHRTWASNWYCLFGDSENRENNSWKINGLSDLFFNYIYIKDWLIHIIGEFFKKIH